MDPKLWGKGFWMLIWCILYDEDKFPDLCEVKKYLDVICRNLPCVMCKEHITINIRDYDIMSSVDREEIKEFFIAVYERSSGHVINDIKLNKKYNKMVREPNNNVPFNYHLGSNNDS